MKKPQDMYTNLKLRIKKKIEGLSDEEKKKNYRQNYRNMDIDKIGKQLTSDQLEELKKMLGGGLIKTRPQINKRSIIRQVLKEANNKGLSLNEIKIKCDQVNLESPLYSNTSNYNKNIRIVAIEKNGKYFLKDQ